LTTAGESQLPSEQPDLAAGKAETRLRNRAPAIIDEKRMVKVEFLQTTFRSGKMIAEAMKE
jgi:hypothetical protein